MIELGHARLSIQRQCALVGLSRSSFYYEPAAESAFNLELMRRIDEQYMRTPFFGSPKMTGWLRRQGLKVNHKRIERLMRRRWPVRGVPARRGAPAGAQAGERSPRRRFFRASSASRLR